MNYEILLGDCIETMRGLPAGSVQTCVTSPPYYGLRDYGHDGQIGLEETPDAYVAKLVEVFREVRRVLRDDGTCWINIGDSYNGSGGSTTTTNFGKQYDGKTGSFTAQPRHLSSSKPKDLLGIPWMVAFALRADGWWLRSDIIWHKPNPMPESVTDRPTKAHEYIFLLSKSQTYFYDADAVAEDATSNLPIVAKLNSSRHDSTAPRVADKDGYGSIGYMSPGKRNRRSVWTVATKPYSGAHFATFPEALIEPCILAGTSAHGCCADCGAPWERVVEHSKGDEEAYARPKHLQSRKSTLSLSGNGSKEWAERGSKTIERGWQPTCACNAAVVPCVVLDPFSGSGTTGAVALKHGRKYIGCELNPDYIELSHDRIQRSQPMLLEVA